MAVRRLSSTLESMATPSCVKAIGKERLRSPHELETPKWRFKSADEQDGPLDAFDGDRRLLLGHKRKAYPIEDNHVKEGAAVEGGSS